MESLWRLGIAVEMLILVCTLAFALILLSLAAAGQPGSRSARNGFVLNLAPKLAGRIFTFMVVPALVGEASFCLCGRAALANA